MKKSELRQIIREAIMEEWGQGNPIDKVIGKNKDRIYKELNKRLGDKYDNWDIIYHSERAPFPSLWWHIAGTEQNSYKGTQRTEVMKIINDIFKKYKLPLIASKGNAYPLVIKYTEK